jgi:hypothetical protein
LPDGKTSSSFRAATVLAALLATMILAPSLTSADDNLVLKLQTDKESYKAGEQMVITANLTKNNEPVLANITFQVDDPAGTPKLILTRPTDNGTAQVIIVIDFVPKKGNYQVYGSARVENLSVTSNLARQFQPRSIRTESPDLTWLWISLALIMTVVGIAAAYSVGRSKGGAAVKSDEEKAALEEKGKSIEQAPPAASEASLPPAPSIPEKRQNGSKAVIATEPFLVDEAFLVYRDGRLLAHETRRLSPKDAEVMTGMFTAVQQFVKESFAEEEELGSLEIGEHEVLLERGRNVFLAVVIKGAMPRDYRETMNGVIRDIEAQYSSIVESWDGVVSSFSGVKKMLLPLFDAASEGTVERSAEVELLSAVEFFQGYIRMKVAVKNASRSVITGVDLEPLYDEDVFKLVKLEPDYPLRKGKIDFGVINPGIKKTVALFLEPMICTECYIEGTLRFKDSEGELHSQILKKKKVEVVCPIFYTDENINTAMLRRLISEELTQQDSRIYYVENLDRSYAIAKEVIRGRQVRLVRELADDDGSSKESWFYGLTQDRKSKIVIKASVRRPAKMLEIFVATPGKLMLTGCLAEIGREISGRLEKEGMVTRQLLDMAKKEQALRETLSLIEKYSEAEMDAGETDQ